MPKQEQVYLCKVIGDCWEQSSTVFNYQLQSVIDNKIFAISLTILALSGSL